MKTLTLSEQDARKIYPNASPEFKITLESSFGKDFFSRNIIERVNSVEDACRELNLDLDDLYDDCEDDYEKAEKAIKTMAEALREGKPASECFYYPYFYRSSGGGFSLYDYVDDLVYARVGARLRVDRPEKARHLGKILEKQYKIYLNG